MSAAEVGRQVQAARVLSGKSQAQVAREMSARGYGWVQATVSAVECGDRSLKWEEGCALGSLMGFGTASLADVEIVEQAAKFRQVASLLGVTL